MQDVLFRIGGQEVTGIEAAAALGGGVLLALFVLALLIGRARSRLLEESLLAADRAQEMDDRLAELARLQSEMTGRLQTVAEVFGSRQGDFVRLIADRIDGLQARVGQGMEASTREQTENLGRLNERLAVIDAAQRNLASLTGEIAGLKDVLSNKQARGAYGQGRMEAIIRDGLPSSAYLFQPTLSNRTRPDCLLRLPGDPRGLVIDAKFPLEAFSQFRAAKGEEARAGASRRLRADVGVHIRDIADKYLIPGETQDLALMFVPAESVYADLAEHFDDVVQRAHRARVVIVSPALLALAIQLLQTLVRDARIREEARVIQTEVGRLLQDVGRLGERAQKLDQHFRQAQDDLGQLRLSAEKIAARGQRIESLEFDEGAATPAAPAADLFRDSGRVLRAVD